MSGQAGRSCSPKAIATFGLLATISGCRAHPAPVTAFAVAAYITGAYFFTASTSFANPAVTVARAMTDTFAGIRPEDVERPGAGYAGQVSLDPRHPRALDRYLGARAHRDAHVGLGQGWRVVHAVARHRDDLSAAFR